MAPKPKRPWSGERDVSKKHNILDIFKLMMKMLNYSLCVQFESGPIKVRKAANSCSQPLTGAFNFSGESVGKTWNWNILDC